MSRYEWSREPWPAVGLPQVPAAEVHLRHVMARLLEQPVENGRLCILGAGPCHDLDLVALQARWAQVDLVDIDASRVQQGVAAQVQETAGIRILKQDLLWGGCRTTAGHSDGIEADRPRDKIFRATWEEVGQDYDRIASTCLLSQLVEQVIEILGRDSPELVTTIQALRLRHLELMARALRPGGVGWLFCDFVSSETLPELLTTTPTALPPLLGQALTAGNVFHGCNPGILLQVMRRDEPLKSLITHPQITNPWIWLTGDRGYAVAGLCFTRV